MGDHGEVCVLYVVVGSCEGEDYGGYVWGSGEAVMGGDAGRLGCGGEKDGCCRG